MFSLEQRVSIAVALAAFVVYRATLAPGLGFIDAGELGAVACTLGIAHPTGYPLFTMVGWLFSKIPLGSEPIVRLNTMSALFCACSVYFAFHIVGLLLPRGARPGARIASCAAAALLWAFSPTLWSTAVAVEVYALHACMLSLTLFAFVRANQAEAPRGWWYVFALAVGLGFANHMSTVFLAPGLLLLYFAEQRGRPQTWTRLARLGLPFALGLSAYLYLPLRAAQAPLMNWGNPTTLERLLWHVGAKQYRVWLFSSSETMGKQLSYFAGRLFPELTYVGAPVALLGLLLLWRESRRLAIGTALLAIGCVAVAINYDIHDIDSYFLLAYFTLALWAGVGIHAVVSFIEKRTSSFALGALCAAALSSAALLSNCEAADRRNDRIVDEYTDNMLASLAPNALVVSAQWDFWVSASYYVQLVQGRRTDVVVIDPELLRRSWYFAQLGKRYPWLIEQSRAEVDAFLADLDRFEHDLPRESYPEIEEHYNAMILSFVQKSIATRPVYVTGEIAPERTRGLQRVPTGLAFRLYGDVAFHPSDIPALRYTPPARSGRLEDMTRTLYASAFLARGEYYLRRGRMPDEARSAFRAALSYDPESVIARRWLSALSR
jgi:4-amino-4-deoxy-L-arabinose transferase-like glycosyltransferase